MKASLRGFFVCDHCRSTCHDGEDEGGPYGPNRCPESYFPRKQRVDCLGPYCDIPCGLQREESDLTKEQLIHLVKYLADYLNTFLVKEEPNA